MTDVQTLSDYMDALSIPHELDHAWLVDSFLAPLGIDPESDLADLCEDIVLATVSGNDAAFHMRPGGWRIDVAGTAVKTLLAGALLSAALFLNGSTDIPAELIPAVIPLLIDARHVQLSRRDRELLVPLRIATKGVEGMALSPHALYNRLDPAVQSQLNRGDFLDFCDRLIETGHMDNAGYGDVKARSADKPAWIRLTWT